MDILKRNHVRVFGQGKQAIVFAHGFGCDQNMWRYITPAFQQNYTIVLYDHVGSGQSDILPTSRRNTLLYTAMP